ncbi:MAG: polyphosphate:AMP phosphotransferase [Gammaproteobacteria bacterium]|nr:polyphosphate:AMP phosphotransferase [Pseudomonadales bacterium]MCP5348283.1 polyphosphate:AMP phosphotransferase [Pseudomonadales bacterium]
MFEVAEVGRSLSKSEYKTLEPQLHFQLLTLQQQLRNSDRSLIVIVAGVEGAGKGTVVDKLNSWFDSRDVRTHAFWDDTDEERERPHFWRYWRILPARGTVGIMFTSWYSKPILDKVFEKIDDSDFESELQRVAELERMLVADGTLIVKLWYHLSKQEQARRLEQDSPIAQFKQSPFVGQYARLYDQFTNVSERALRLTDSGIAPWHIIEATDNHYRNITTARILVTALQQRFPEPDSSPEIPTDGPVATATLSEDSRLTVLDTLDMDRSLSDADYDARLEAAQLRLHQLAWTMQHQKKNAVIVFEGWDAAGKGGAIRRLTAAIDARLYRVIPIAAPSDEELAHHYLWRFWRHVPRAGFLTIYDRSWYGRVLVERVENLAKRDQWTRAYQEINNFEENLVSHGTTVLKFWMHISKDEQKSRFREREGNPLKRHKITEEDWRNRDRWDDYKLAVNDMVAHTSTEVAPWLLVPGNDKKYARVTVIEKVCEQLEAKLQS